MSETLNNLSITTVNRAALQAMGASINSLYSFLANGGRDRHCKFYYNSGAGGSILQVAAKSVVGGAVSDIKDIAVNHFNSLLHKDGNKKHDNSIRLKAELEKQEREKKLYGRMDVDGGTILALDDWGCIAPEALMLGIEQEDEIAINQTFPDWRPTSQRAEYEKHATLESNRFTTHTLVWYDTTALVSVDSDKKMVITNVVGRDYSRKELVSNGDIKFSVHGQITSGQPDIYPTEEIQKFIKVMQYKGVVKVNNIVLNELGITEIVIQNYNISPKQGYKALQNYSFSAIGLQPESEIKITNDTVEIIPQAPMAPSTKDDSEWMKMLNNQLEGLKSHASDMLSYGTAIAGGLLGNTL